MNNQPVEPLDHDCNSVEVVEIFNTIQGEGPFVGCPAVFIRFAGCTLQCPLCDTNYTQGRKRMLVTEVAASVLSQLRSSRLVVLTGGEPLRQYGCRELIYELNRHAPAGTRIQLETNGTVCPWPIPWFVCTVCSPKTSKIHPEVEEMVYDFSGAYKYVVEAGWTHFNDGLPMRSLGKEVFVARPPEGFPADRVYVQPVDTKDEAINVLHRAEAIEVCRRYGYRLCLQIQKIIGMP